MKKLMAVWKRVFSNWKYLSTLLVAGFLFYFLNGILFNARNLAPIFSSLGFFSGMRNNFLLAVYFYNGLPAVSAVGVFVLSFLFGVLVSLMFYRHSVLKNDKVKVGLLGSFGILMGAAAPGCAACGIGIMSVIGLTSALATLPFRGQEVMVLSVIAVGFAVVKITRKLYNPVCEINFNEK